MPEQRQISKHNKELELEYTSRTMEGYFTNIALLLVGAAIFAMSFVTGGMFLGLTSFCFILAAVIKWFLSTMHNYITIKLENNLITINHQHNYGVKEKDTHYSFTLLDVKQFYIKKVVKSLILKGEKSSKRRFYEIWIHKNDGQRVRMLGIEEGFWETNERKAYATMSKISKLSRINNPSEVISKLKTYTPKPIIRPRQITKEQNPHKLKIQDLREGVLVDFHDETWEVIAQIQYDWKLENTDMLYQIKNGKSDTTFLFVCQNLAIYTTWLEERLTQHELMSNQLDKISQNLPLEFTFRDTLFLKEHFNTGYEFVSKSENGVKIKQWKYISEDGKKSLRILEHDDQDTFVFLGKKIEEFEFSNILIS